MKLINKSILADYITENEDTFAYAIEHKDRDVLEKAIANIQTSYDVDRVVKNIKELMQFYNNCKKYGNKNTEQQKKSYGTTLNYEVADFVEEIIQIVKEG